MSSIDINDYTNQKDCWFENEHYSVRDNGAVLRHSKSGGRKRSLDNIWTFGKESSSNFYLYISSVRIHRIVATAFLGEPPDSKYVVDHKDTNCRNNRPENLRWLSRLENALKNPVTRKKIAYLCGSIDVFLKNPSVLNDKRIDSSISWMRSVSPDEAKNCKIRMNLWSKAANNKNNSYFDQKYDALFADRVFKPLHKWEADLTGEPGLDFSLTPWCAQYMWGKEVYFPCCPQEFFDHPLLEYYAEIKPRELFAYSEQLNIPTLNVYKSELMDSKSSILVLCSRDDDNWTIVGIWLNKKQHFIHFNLGSFGSKDIAEQHFQEDIANCNFWSVGFSCNWMPKENA